jgi:hypothetical protein
MQETAGAIPARFTIYAPLVQWIDHNVSTVEVRVRILHGAPIPTKVISMTVRAKFKVESYSTRKSGDEELRSIRLVPVYSSDPNSENAKFFKWSPSGSIELGTINPSAWAQFELDKEYYVDFTPAQ